MLIRSDQALILVKVEGVSIDKLPWSMFEGAEGNVEGDPVLPGGMSPQVAVGGVPKLSDITVERDWSDALAAVYKKLMAARGSAVAEVSWAILKRNKVPTGDVFSYSGVLIGVNRPNYKAGSSDGAMLKLVIQTNGEIA